MKGGKRKFITGIAVAISLVVCVWITKTTKASLQTIIMNNIVLGIMLFLILIAYLCGIRKVNGIIRDIQQVLERMNKMSGIRDSRIQLRKLTFENTYLKEKYESFLKYQQQYANADIEEFINGDEISISTHRSVWEIFSDFLTSLGILGTFVGLIIGIQGFTLTDMTLFSDSVTSLLDGIKVAFLTSVYGISLSLSYSYGLLSTYGDMEAVVDIFLEKFHILWGKEQGHEEKVLEEQKQQTEMLRELTETFQEQLAVSFAEVITPTIMKLNDQFETYSDGQRQMLKDAATQFAEEFKNAFLGGFAQFEQNLEKSNEMQVRYMEFLDCSIKNLSKSITEHQVSVDNYILKGTEQQNENLKAVTGQIKKLATSVNEFSLANDKYYDAINSVTDRMTDTQDALVKDIETLMDDMKVFAEDLQKNSGRDYSQVLESLQENNVNGTQQILQAIQAGEEEFNKNYLYGVEKICNSVEEKQRRIVPLNNLNADLGELLIQLQELVELEKRRQKRGLFFKKKR